MGLISTIFKRTTPENPSFDLNSDAAWDAFGANKSASGVGVNRKTALGYPPWWRAVTLISNWVGKIPLHTYRRVGEGKNRATDHPLYQMLRYEPNEYQSINIFRSQLTGHAVSTGNGYAYIERKAMRPISLLPLDPDCVTPEFRGGALWYKYTVNGESKYYAEHEVLHIKGFGFDGLCGYSIIQLAKDALGLGMAQQKFMATALKNGASPRIVLEAPMGIKQNQAEQLRESWERMHSGIDAAHRTALLQWGIKANKIGFSPDDIKLIDSQKLSLIDIANLTGLPVHKVGGEGRTAYASLEQENQSFLDDALDFWLNQWEHECRKKLLTEQEKADDTIVIEFLRSAVVRGDMTARAAWNRAALGGQPWETVNEARARENENPLEGYDEIKQPANMGGVNNEPADPAADNVKPTGPNSGNGDSKRKRLAESVAAILNDAQRRAVRRLATHAEKAARQPRGFNDWLARVNTEHQKSVREILTPAYRAYHDLHDSDADANQRADEFLEAIRAELDELSGRVKASELTERVAAWAASKEKNDGTQAA